MRNGIVLVLGTALMLSGCLNVHVGDIKEHDRDGTEPKMFVKEGLTQDEMILDSVNCQDMATAVATSNANYTSSVGFTPEQVQIYDNCMFSKGYKEI